MPHRSPLGLRWLKAGLLSLACCCAAPWALAADNNATPPSAAPPAYKLTTGLYNSQGGDAPKAQALDVNLRHSSDIGNVWLAHYAPPQQEQAQTRLGWDRSYSVSALRIAPSLQLATGGAWNSSLSVETGDTWYAGVGLGRTNLRDSFSLNFDPNDSLTLSGGYRWHESESLGFMLVRDNRLHTDQQHLHLIYRTPLPQGHRLTVDVLFKTGLVDDQPIARTGLALTYDWPRYFVRVAYDPQVNFTAQNMLRLVLGTRF